MSDPPKEPSSREIRIVLEKLQPTTSLPGRDWFAEFARITRFIQINNETLEETEFAQTTIEVVSNVTIASQIQRVEDSKTRLELSTQEQHKVLDKELADLNKLESAIAVDPLEIVP